MRKSSFCGSLYLAYKLINILKLLINNRLNLSVCVTRVYHTSSRELGDLNRVYNFLFGPRTSGPEEL